MPLPEIWDLFKRFFFLFLFPRSADLSYKSLQSFRSDSCALFTSVLLVMLIKYRVILLPVASACTTFMAQAVSRWLPTAKARVRAMIWQVGFVVDKVALVQVFSEYFCFPCQSLLHQILHHHTHPGHVQWASSGRRAEWTQYGLHPPTMRI
jgi:hypothetical protein